MYQIFIYLRRRGFTLAEILVATVIAGYCILPVVGTMQGGIRHTENFNHREKLRLLARSRLNKELAAGAFDHSAVNSAPTYHYVFRHPVSEDYVSIDAEITTDNASFPDLISPSGLGIDDLMYSYQVNVSVRENVIIATTSSSIDPDMLKAPRGLKAVVVNAELLDGPYVIATDSISYFSLLTVPSFGDQFIWISNSSMLRILAIDASTRTIAETFQLPLNPAKLDKAPDEGEHDDFRPWNIDLHPSRRLIGIQGKFDIKLLNVDKSHSSYQQSSGLVATATHPTATTDYYGETDKDSSKAEKDRGLVFRPDGKYFFVTAHKDKALYVYQIEVATDTSSSWWPPPVTFIRRFGLKAAENGSSETEDDDFTDLIAGSDGYLYLALKSTKNVIRFPMYPESFTGNWTYETLVQPVDNKKVNSVWTSNDGKYVYVLSEEEPKVAQFSSMPLSRIGIAAFNSDDNFRDFKLSHDSRYLMLTDKKDATNLGGLRGKLVNEIDFAATPSGINLTRAYPYKLKSDLSVLSPTGNDILFTNKDKPELYFIDTASLAANIYTSSIPADRILTYDSSNKPCADIVTRVPEHMLIGAGNSAADSTIEFFDLHTFRFDEDRRISSLRGIPRTIGVSPQGTRFKVGYDSVVKGVDAYNMIDSSNISVDELSGNSRIVSYAADDETVRHASGVATYSANFYASLEVNGSGGSFNGYWIENSPGSSFGDSALDVAWVPQDMKAMPNGGFLMLYRKSDGSAMLDWVGKIKWGADKGKYQRFARWISPSAPSTLPTSPEPGNPGNVDTSVGCIQLLQASNFPVGTTITHVTYTTGPFAGTRYFTPVIVEINAGVKTIKDYATSISSTQNLTDITSAISWQVNGGLIQTSNYYVGFWFGQIGGSAGQGLFDHANTGGSYGSDYVNAGPTAITSAQIVGGNHVITSGPNDTNRQYPVKFTGTLPVTSSFPPRYAQNIAISPDEGFLAIEASGTPHVVYLYDFATNNFGHETQLPGLIMDNRNTGTDFNVAVPAGSRFTGGGIKLRETFTANHAWAYLKTEPVNYNNATTDAKRVFGYFQPKGTVDKFYLIREDVARLFVDNSPPNELLKIWSLATTPYGPGARQILASTSVFIQADHGTDGAGNGGIAPMYTTDSAVSTITQPSVSGNKYGTTANWQHITASETRPLNFQPVFLRSYPLSGCNTVHDTALAFSRDLANPILFQLDPGQDDIWALKPGASFTRIDIGGSFDCSDKQLVVSPDGQKLIFAEDTGSNRIFVTNIGNPDSFAFDGTPISQSSISPASFGSLITTVPCNTPPKALGVMPFNSYKSTTRLGKYELAGKLNAQVYGNNGAALASGAIYVLGGSVSDANGNPTNKIFAFKPMTPATVAPLTATLTQTLKLNSVVAYDGKIYSFNGAKTSTNTDTTSWVQRYDPATDEVISSADPPPSPPPPGDLQVSYNQSSLPTPTVVTDSGNTQLGDVGSEAFDGSIAAGELWCPTIANQSLTYNAGNSSLRFVVNKIWLNNDTSPTESGLKNFTISGSNDNFSTTPYSQSFSVPSGQTNWTTALTNLDAYQYYKFTVTSNQGGVGYDYAAREIKFFRDNVRPVPDYDFTGASTPGPHSVTRSGAVSSTEEAWKAFDSDPASTRWTCNGTSGQHITLTLATPDILDIVSIRCNTEGRVNNFFIKAANQADFSDSVDLKIGGSAGSTVGVHQNTTAQYIYFLDNSTAYTYYRLYVQSIHSDSDVEVSDLQYYSTHPEPGAASPLSGSLMTKTITDARGSIAVSSNAACQTPYGIVVAGGYTGSATNTAIVYWPHAIDEYTDATNHSFGISRSLPPLSTPVFAHNLIWHKGKLYRIGGYTSGTTNATNINIFDFDANSWTPIANNVASFTNITGTTVTLAQPAYAGVCSFGDEIFIFGGMIGSTATSTAVAWNPETSVVRPLGNLPAAKAGIAAVPCGSSIYLFIPLTGETGVYKFTP
ncbi:MAG: hypothetical protein GQF41_3204 [Candidatus Rifleibacterium amylolyticum]|nr:MAG: hypothetical protein GQF41_3204 [Candidatus Rifleibacterium amylolyticum]